MTGPALPTDFEDCLRELLRHEVEFRVVGAFALARYGYVRATGDLDILFRPTPANVARLSTALAAFGAPPHSTDPASLSNPDSVLQLGVRPLRIDLLNSLSGVTLEEAFAEPVMAAFGSVSYPVIGLEALRRNKLSTGRPSDLHDVAELDRLPPPKEFPSAH